MPGSPDAGAQRARQSGEAAARHVKATRSDWLDAARVMLIQHGVGEVKILALGARLGVSRSSFYWYFESRADLLDALLGEWEARNTAAIVAQCDKPAPRITAAVCNFFRCFLDPAGFDPGLDFAVREWARRDDAIRRRVDAADRTRLASVTAMFARHGYDKLEADARARILYFMQLGYHALEVREPIAERIGRIDAYLSGFTGKAPDPQDTAELRALAATLHEA